MTPPCYGSVSLRILVIDDQPDGRLEPAPDAAHPPADELRALALHLTSVAHSILSGTLRVSMPGEVVRSGEVEVDLAARTVTRSGLPIELTRREFDLLAALARRHGAVASRTDLLREIWGSGTRVSARVIDVHVARLRRKLEQKPGRPRRILTSLARGYRLALGEPGAGERAALDRAAAEI